MVLCQVTSTSRSPQITMNSAITRHQELHEEIEQPSSERRQLVGEVGDVHVQVEPVAGRRADEGQHDGEQDRERLRP